MKGGSTGWRTGEVGASDSVRVLRDGTKLAGANLLVMLASVAFSLTLIRILSKTELAALPILHILVGLVGVVVGLGLPAAAVRRIPEALQSEDRSLAVWLARTTLLANLCLSIVVCVAIYEASPFVASVFFKTAQQSHVIRLLIPAVLFGVVAQCLSMLSMAAQRFGTQAVMNIVLRTGQSAVGVTCLLLFGFEGFVLGLAAAPLVAVVIGLIGLRDLLFGEARRQPLARHLHFSLPFYLNGGLRFALMNADQTVIALLLSPSALATYYVARRFSGYLFSLSNTIFNPILPQLARLRATGIEAVASGARTTSRYLPLMLVPVTLGSCAIAYPFIGLVAGPRYSAAAPVFVVLCLAEIAYGVYGIFSMSVFVINRPRDTLLLDGTTGVLALLVTAGMAASLGGIGAAAARLVSFGIGAAVGSMVVRRVVRISPDWSAMRKVTIACIPMVVTVILAQCLWYSLWLLPCYVLLGAIVLVPFHARLWTVKDLKLAQGVLPRCAQSALGTLALLAPAGVRDGFIRPAGAAEVD